PTRAAAAACLAAGPTAKAIYHLCSGGPDLTRASGAAGNAGGAGLSLADHACSPSFPAAYAAGYAGRGGYPSYPGFGYPFTGKHWSFFSFWNYYIHIHT
ncbi:hypothetical protein BLA29_008182, partial [Euroglyphus maynei]